MDPDEPQKPKSTRDGKQRAGPSYSARSKVKRISHSDGDNSGSQAHLPPLKDQTRMRKLGNLGINNDDDPGPIDSNTVDEYTSAETALQNDLVLETLFKYVDWSDLLRCRIVNKQWQDEATKELRRRKLVIKFSFHSQRNYLSGNIAFRNICRSLSECRTPSLLSYFEVKTAAPIHLGSAGMTSIFTTVGYQLKHLKLDLNPLNKMYSFKRRSFMTHLQNLLVCQAPNLEFLEIKFDVPDDWTGTDNWQALDSSSSDPLQNDHNEFGLLPNLKTFIVTGIPPSNFFADVMNAGVNLRSVGGVWSTSSLINRLVTPDGGLTPTPLRGSSLTCLNYFLNTEGRDKIHLLKHLRIYLVVDSDFQYDGRKIELIETFLMEQKQNLKLETFECVSILFEEDASIAPRVVGVINQILECSAGSLHKLRIESPYWFDDLLIIPRLPNLQEICFDCALSSLMGHLDGGDFFPPGFNINNSFPNVSSIVLLRCSVRTFWLFVRRMEIEMTNPVPSIRNITLIDVDKTYDSVFPLVTDFLNVFPNLVSIRYVDNQKYYKIHAFP